MIGQVNPLLMSASIVETLCDERVDLGSYHASAKTWY